MGFTIKRANITHAKEISCLFNLYRIFYGQSDDQNLALLFISERLKNNESVIFFAHDENGLILGFTQLYPMFSSVSAKPIWILNDLFVKLDFRRSGIGRSLMEEAKKFARQKQAAGIALHTAKDNKPAQSLYEALGYKKDNDYYNYFLAI